MTMPEEIVSEQPVPVVFEPAAAPAEAPAPAPAEDKEAPVQEAEAKPEEGDDKPRDAKGKFTSPTQERINELTRARREAEREAEYWKQRASPAKTEAPAPKPEVGNFQDYNEYIEAMADWKADQKVAKAFEARDAEAAKSAEQRVQESKAQTFHERVNAAKASIPDFDAVVNATEAVVPQHVTDAILESEKGAELLYHLAKHPEQAERLAQMSVREADREIGRIEATLGQTKTAPVTKPASKAPAPMRPTGSGAATAVTNDPGKMSHEEYRAMRKSQGARWA